MNFIENPNLPGKDVKLVIMSGIHSEICKNIKQLGIDIIKLEGVDFLSKPEASHADMLFHHLGGKNIVISKHIKDNIITHLRNLNFNIIQASSTLKPEYPNNIALNAARINDLLFCKQKNLDPAIGKYCKNNRIGVINVNQGYAKCSVAIVNENSIITSDKSIYDKAIEYNIDALRIRPGFIDLKGYDYGFIGGCCGLIGKNKIVFTGNIRNHPDYIFIKNFLDKKGITYISLTDGNLIDIGGLIPLLEI